MATEKMAQIGDPGVCGFCGIGAGYLGDQGDESTQILHSAVRSGEPGNYSYKPHPGALKSNYGQQIVWCGNCIGGLTHKWQRYDETNLRALLLSNKLRLELDGLRWVGWETHSDREQEAVAKYLDDPSLHLEKLQIRRELEDLENEQFRRAGFDLTTRGWRL